MGVCILYKFSRKWVVAQSSVRSLQSTCNIEVHHFEISVIESHLLTAAARPFSVSLMLQDVPECQHQLCMSAGRRKNKTIRQEGKWRKSEPLIKIHKISDIDTELKEGRFFFLIKETKWAPTFPRNVVTFHKLQWVQWTHAIRTCKKMISSCFSKKTIFPNIPRLSNKSIIQFPLVCIKSEQERVLNELSVYFLLY